MPPLTSSPRLERVRAALRPRYEIERELIPGIVFHGRDISLKRAVVIKVLDPEVADEPTSRRFLREARILARLSHPNIVAIHETGESGGLLYYVRDFLEGESLAARLSRGRLSPARAVHLGRDLLAALAAAHRAGVIHRDLQPGNVFCLEERAVLADFGIARSSAHTSTGDDGPNSPTAYASPEQLAGGEITARTDLYAAGLLLYEAMTGRAYPTGLSVARASWSGVPRGLRAVLRRALAPVPADRWPDAGSFDSALELAAARPRPRAGALYAAVAAALLVLIYREVPELAVGAGLVPHELAIVPLEGQGQKDSLGADLAHLVQLNLENLPGLSLIPSRQLRRWWESHGQSLIGGSKAGAARELRVHWLAHGRLDVRGDSLVVRITVYDSAGRKTPIPEVRAPRGDLGALSDTVAISLVRTIAPQLAGSFRDVGDMGGVRLPALREFLRGEAAFQQDAWSLAERHFEAALDLDSSFALAAWRLANVKRWRRLPYDDDLRVLYEDQSARLRPLDRLLIAALREPDIKPRLARLDSVISRFPDDGYARLLYGEELFHRGPLVGRGIDEGTDAMASAIARDSSLALPYDHLVFAGIRLGRRSYARAMLDRRRRVTPRPSPGDPDVLKLSELAYDERFVPWRARLKRVYLGWTADSSQIEGLQRVFRTAVPWFDIPQSQVALSDLLLRTGPQDSMTRASVHEGKALGLMTLGRPAQALMELDSAAALFHSNEARLEQAEWRVVLPALGLPLPRAGSEWQARLAALSSNSTLGHRAAWALAFDAMAGGDTVAARHWAARLRSTGIQGQELHRFLDAMAKASQGQWGSAVAMSDSLSATMNATRAPDPFARSVFHIQRGSWFAAMGNAAAADREWLWYESSDVDGWPAGLAQAGEIDGMLGVYARFLRGRQLLEPGARPGGREAGCGYLQRVKELWSNAEPSLARLTSEVAARVERCAP